MTEAELGTIIRAMAPAIRECVTKALSEVAPRVGILETRLEELKAIPDLRDRLVMIETKAAVALPVTGMVGPPGPPGERGPQGEPGPSGRDGRDGLPGVQGEKGISGLDGKDGAPGRDGLNGKDGIAGLSYEGPYQDAKQYEVGQVVFFAGGSWHCNEPTMSKPGESKAWGLVAKRGRDGKDGRDAVAGLPVVSVGSR
jgi:hypothetical protein